MVAGYGTNKREHDSQVFEDKQRQILAKDLSERYQGPLRAYFMRRVATKAEAEDLTQEVFLRILRRIDAPEIENAKAFLFQTAVNLLRDHSRKGKTRNNYLFTLPEDRGATEVFSPERVLIAREALQSVISALNELGEKSRDIFLLHRLENMKYREIAELYGISQSAVEKHMIKALAHIARRVDLK